MFVLTAAALVIFNWRLTKLYQPLKRLVWLNNARTNVVRWEPAMLHENLMSIWCRTIKWNLQENTHIRGTGQSQQCDLLNRHSLQKKAVLGLHKSGGKAKPLLRFSDNLSLSTLALLSFPLFPSQAGLASHWLYASQTSVVYPPTDSKAMRGRWAPHLRSGGAWSTLPLPQPSLLRLSRLKNTCDTVGIPIWYKHPQITNSIHSLWLKFFRSTNQYQLSVQCTVPFDTFEQNSANS